MTSIPERHRQTDRQTDDLLSHSIASRGENYNKQHIASKQTVFLYAYIKDYAYSIKASELQVKQYMQ